MSTNVSLTPELEKFARDCVDGGRYGSLSEVMQSALRLLQEWERKRDAFIQTLVDAEEESDRLGWVSLEDAMAEADRIIDEA